MKWFIALDGDGNWAWGSEIPEENENDWIIAAMHASIRAFSDKDSPLPYTYTLLDEEPVSWN